MEILKVTGKKLPFETVVQYGEGECYPIQISKNEYIAPTAETIWNFMNHSCNPNCGVTENLQFVAIKEINAGEELFFDYSTTMLERH